MISDIELVLKKLFSLQRLGIKVGLEHTEELLSKIGEPHKKLKCIHIAGTNGKGSTCAIINKILIEHGLVVGLYTSPHLVRFNERIQINGEKISDEYIAKFMMENSHHIKKIKTTFFETTTAMAFDYFYKKSVDIAIIETGLGGRLDSTNVISPLVCGITSISLDHMDILGNTIEKISKEKSGIIKKNTPVVIFEQTNSIIEIISNTANSKNAPLTIIKNEDVNIIKTNSYNSQFIYKNYDIKLTLKGEHQVFNCALAINIVEKTLDKIDSNKVKKAIHKSYWPGRMEKISDKNIYYDVAHNYGGIKSMITAVNMYHPQKKLVGLFCIKADKNILSICNLLRNHFYKIIICQDKHKYLLSVNTLSKIMRDQKINSLSVSSVEEGLNVIGSIDQEEFVGLIFGSHYIAKEVYHGYGKHFDTNYNLM